MNDKGNRQEFTGLAHAGSAPELVAAIEVQPPARWTALLGRWLGPALAAAIVGCWAALLAAGTALALVIGQNRSLPRRVASRTDMLRIAVGALVSGAAAGIAGQALFGASSGSTSATLGARVLAWMLIGAILGFGLSRVVPNLHRKAPLAGATGAVLGALIFVVISNGLPEPAGRLLAASVIGFLIGLMVVLAKATGWVHRLRAYRLTRVPRKRRRRFLSRLRLGEPLRPTPRDMTHAAPARRER